MADLIRVDEGFLLFVGKLCDEGSGVEGDCFIADCLGEFPMTELEDFDGAFGGAVGNVESICCNLS